MQTLKNALWPLLLVAMLLIFLTPLSTHPLLEPDEGRYAEIPREMIESGDYVTPRLNYVKYFEKPVLLYWMNVLSFKVFGENVFAARLPNALCALAGILTVALFGNFLSGRRVGIIAAVVTGTSLLYIAIGTLNLTDMPVSCFMTVALAAFYRGHMTNSRRWYLIFYAAMALAVLTKGLIGIVLPCGVVFWYMVFTRRWRIVRELLYLPGVLLFFLISVPWFYFVCRENPDFFHFFFIQEHFLRYATKIHDRYEPFWFFIPMIPAGLLPWAGFLLALGRRGGALRNPQTPEKRDADIFLFTWFGVIFLFFSLSSSKLIPYIVPCLSPLALLIARDVARMMEKGDMKGPLRLTVGINLLFVVALLAYAFVGDEMPKGEALATAFAVSAGLLLGSVLAVIYGLRYGRADRAVFGLCVGALLFAVGLNAVYIPIGRTRSAAETAYVVRESKMPEERIAVFGEVLQSMPFYTKERVVLVEYTGELEYGSKAPEAEGWFLARDEFLADWDAGVPYALVLRKSYLQYLFPEGVRGATKELDVGKYVVFFNRVAQ